MIPDYSASVPTATQPDGSVVVGAAGGLQFHLTWDSSVSSAPSAFKSAVIIAASYFAQMYTNSEIVNLNVGYGECGGAPMPAGDLSDSQRLGSYTTYTSLLTALQRDAGWSNIQATADASLPSTDPLGAAKTSIFGTLPNYYVTYAEAKALGLMSATGAEVDGYIGLSRAQPMSYTEPVASGTYDAIGCIVSEIAAVMGRVDSMGSLFGNGNHTPLDLFRYASSGVRDTGSATSPYFSFNGGRTNLAPYTTSADPGLWSSLIRGDAFGYGAAGVTDSVSPVDLAELAVIGYRLSPTGLAATQTLSPLA